VVANPLSGPTTIAQIKLYFKPRLSNQTKNTVKHFTVFFVCQVMGATTPYESKTF
jgi:hypothetical protein